MHEPESEKPVEVRDPHEVPVMEPQKQPDPCLASSDGDETRGEAKVSVVRLRRSTRREVVVRILVFGYG